MATTTVSDFSVIETPMNDDDVEFRVLSPNVFFTQEEALNWLFSRLPYINAAILDGWLRGAELLESRIPARFFVVGATSERSETGEQSYLGFGARIVDETDHFYVVGVPQDHARSLALLLASGPHYFGPTPDGLRTLEDAIAHAEDFETRLYG
jgi:hypothetical protein